MYAKADYDPLMDAYRCEICGQWYRGLGYHISKKHGITTAEYKEKFGLNKTTRLLSKEYIEKKRLKLEETGLITNLETSDKYRFKKGEKSARRHYKRRPETLYALARARRLAINTFKKRRNAKKRKLRNG